MKRDIVAPAKAGVQGPATEHTAPGFPLSAGMTVWAREQTSSVSFYAQPSAECAVDVPSRCRKSAAEFCQVQALADVDAARERRCS